MDDIALLRRYAETRSEEAFTELVQRHLNLVYSAALRQVGGDVHRAEDVTQVVFAEVARKAASLCRHPALAGWLYTTTHYTAAKMVRAEKRRQIREQEAQVMNDIFARSEPEVDWEQVRPVLDAAMHELSKGERDAVVLRFFDQRRMTEVGERLGLTESAARKRMDRALENLRTLLSRRGIASTPAALAAILANQAVSAAPAGLAATVSSSALGAGASGGASLVTLLHLMSTTKIAVSIAVITLSVGLGTYLAMSPHSRPNVPVAPVPVSSASTLASQPVLPELAAPPAPVASVSLEAARAQDIIGMAQKGLLAGFRIVPQTANMEKRAEAQIAILAEILALSPAETETLQQMVENARQSIYASIVLGATVRRSSDAEVVIQLGDAAVAANATAVNLDHAIRQLLGDERYAAYEKLGSKEGIEGIFRSAGLNATTITITRTRDNEVIGDRGQIYPRQYMVRYDPAPGVDSANAMRMRSGTSTNVPAQVMGPLGAFLPGDF